MFGVFGKLAGKLLGTDKAIESTIQVAKDGLDALIYTEEERETNALVERAKAREMIVDWLNATQGQNLARRLIALSITFVWLGLKALSMCLAVVAIWVKDSDKYFESAETVQSFAETMTGAMMLILSFYFAAPHMGMIVKGAMSKFGTKQKIKKGN